MSPWMRHCWYLLTLLCSSALADIEVGKEPPDYLGTDPEGKKVLVSEHRGRLVVITFFASWCAPCRAELPVLEALQRVSGKDKIQVVAVNYKESVRDYRRIQRTLDDYTLTFTHDASGKIGKAYDVRGIPRLVIVGKDGAVAAQHVGYNEKDLPKLLAELERLLQQDTPPLEPASPNVLESGEAGAP